MGQPGETLLSKPVRADWFASTHWSVVVAAQEGDCPSAREALESLCRTYWYPLYVFVRRNGYSPEDAQDLTQSFFARVLEKDYFAKVDRSQGKFRAFLLVSLKHFISDQRDRQRAAKRGGGQVPLSLDAAAAEGRYHLEPVDAATPEKLYERRWALTVLAQARARLRQEFEASGRLELYEQLTGIEAGGEAGLTYARIGERCGLGENAIKSAALRLRRRYAELIRQEVAQTVASVAEINEEIRHLLAVIGS